MPDNNLSALDNIRTKVRRLTRSPSQAQLRDVDLDGYINTFVLYDFPEQLRLFSLKTNLTFYVKPGIDAYSTVNLPITDPLYNYKNLYMNVEPPVYVAGFQVFYTESQEQFYAIYPKVNNQVTLTKGNGILTNFTGKLPTPAPLLLNEVTFTSIDTNGNGLVLEDDGNGNLVIPNGVATVPVSTINYTTGVYVLNFPTAPGINKDVVAQTVPVVLNRPQALLYFDDTFYVRPVPDQPYRVELQVNMRPAELLNGAQMPELAQWWQYIAYGASKKIFEDRMDMDSVQLLMAEFKKQETLIQRRTIVQMTPERTATIYTENVGSGYGAGWGGSGWGPW